MRPKTQAHSSLKQLKRTKLDTRVPSRSHERIDATLFKLVCTCLLLLLVLPDLISNALCSRATRSKRAATARLDRLWDDAVIPYEIDSMFDQDHAILFRSAMRHWENYTCIRFVEREPDEHKNYIVFTERTCGCCSFVGKRGNGPQAISIGKHCDKFGIVVHELGHVVGFWHEHTRPDRDQHVQIVGKNIMPGQEYNFNKLTREEVNSLGLAYDYDSILHYATNTFSRDTQLDTILPLHGSLNTEEVEPVRASSIVADEASHASNKPAEQMIKKLANSSSSIVNDAQQTKLNRDLQSMINFRANEAPQVSRNKRDSNLDTQDEQFMLAIDGSITKAKPDIGQRVRLSAGDIAQTNLLYRCPKCGRTIQQSSGSLHSPGYYSSLDKRSSSQQLNSPHSTGLCEWRITTGQGERIMLNITDLDLAPPSGTSAPKTNSPVRIGMPRTAISDRDLFDAISSRSHDKSDNPLIMSRCDDEYLEIRDGYIYRAPLLARLCGHLASLRDSIRPIVSSTNRLLIVLRNSPTSRPVRRGFLAQHSSICGGPILLKDSYGVEASSHASTKQQMFDKDITSYIQRSLSNGSLPSENEVLLNSQTNIRRSVTSLEQLTSQINSNPTLIELMKRQLDQPSSDISSSSHSSRGDNYLAETAAFKWSPNVINSSRIESPNWPEQYGASKECIWYVRASPSHRVTMSFDAFDLESHDSCAYDYVEVRDGSLPSSKLLGRFCGQKNPKVVLSSSRNLLVKFVSDSDVNRSGFLASLRSELDYCGLGLHDCSHQCSNSVSPYKCTCPKGLELASDGKSCTLSCGGLRNDTYGKITSPNFPEFYPIDSKCSWTIRAPSANHYVALNFTYFDLEGLKSNECFYDYIDLKSKIGENQFIKHGRFCGSNQAFSVISASNELHIEFISDESVQKRGFMANYIIDEDECANQNGGCDHTCLNDVGSYSCLCNQGFILDADKHTCRSKPCSELISSAQGTLNFSTGLDPKNLRSDCSWLFSTSPGHRKRILFNKVKFESNNICATSNLTVYDGIDGDLNLMNLFCRTTQPPDLVSTSSSLNLRYRASETIQKFSFQLSHSTVCGGRVSAVANQSNLIYSHPEFDGTSSYGHNEDCQWVVEAGSSQKVRVEITYFALEPDGVCTYDYLAFYDGSEESSMAISRLCGTNLTEEQSEVTSNSNSMLIVFRSDDTISSRGFSLVYSAVELS